MRRLDILPGLDWLRRGPIALAAFAALASPVHASPVQASDYYAGKTITFLVGTDTGGGFSLYARAIAKYLARHIPGNPMIVIRNMPGAGGAVASTWLYHIAPKDGTAIGSVAPNAILGRLLGEGRGGYEPEKFNYLAGAERSTRVCVTFHHSQVRTLQDALSHSAIIGATSVGSPTREYASIIKRTTGARFEIVSGYKGPADLFVAMERGEIDGICGIDWSALKAQQPDWLREGKLNLLVQGALPPHPELASLGVPTPWAYIKDDIDRKAVELMVEFQQAFGRTYMAPPGVPAEALHVLRSAFMAVLRDPDFLVDAKNLRIDVTPQAGEHIQRIVEAVHAAPRQVVERLKQIVEP
jgi:tripartite-type tricarboxylate transporter receptor subunit TctC